MIVAALIVVAALAQDADAPAGAPAPPAEASPSTGPSTGAALLERLGFSNPARSGEQRGVRLLHEARRAVEAGDVERARQLLTDARVEWPGSPWVAQSLGDLHAEQGETDEALFEYQRGARDGFVFRSAYQAAVASARAAETLLSSAGVPDDEAALPEGPLPQGMRPAIEQALPRLERARRDFCAALAETSDARARESVLALTRRIDELRRMLEREDPEQGEDGEQGDQDQQQDGQQDEQGQDEGEPDQQDPRQDPNQPQPEERPQSQDDVEEPDAQDAPPQDQPLEPLESESVSLTEQQLQELLDKLEELEERAIMLARRTRQREHQGVEKDW